MVSISSAVSGGLAWSKTPRRRGFELKRNGEVLGSLRRTSCWSSESQAESSHGSWRFHRTGFLRLGTEIVDSRSNTRIATLKPNWTGGGKLIFSDGQIFSLSCRGLWRPVWTVRAEDGQPVLTIHSRGKTVELTNELHLQEYRLILLVMFTWHMMRQASEDAASAAVVAAIS
jgi:hypothetical protein